MCVGVCVRGLKSLPLKRNHSVENSKRAFIWKIQSIHTGSTYYTLYTHYTHTYTPIRYNRYIICSWKNSEKHFKEINKKKFLNYFCRNNMARKTQTQTHTLYLFSINMLFACAKAQNARAHLRIVINFFFFRWCMIGNATAGIWIWMGWW